MFGGGKGLSNKKIVGLIGPTAYTNFHTGRKREIQNCKGPFHGIVQQI